MDEPEESMYVSEASAYKKNDALISIHSSPSFFT